MAVKPHVLIFSTDADFREMIALPALLESYTVFRTDTAAGLRHHALHGESKILIVDVDSGGLGSPHALIDRYRDHGVALPFLIISRNDPCLSALPPSERARNSWIKKERTPAFPENLHNAVQALVG